LAKREILRKEAKLGEIAIEGLRSAGNGEERQVSKFWDF
jgi:hypothetical protein